MRTKFFLVPEGEPYKEVISWLLLSNENLFLLEGGVGSGKTTFTSEFIKNLSNSTGTDFKSLNVMSPTYSIINEYKLKDDLIFHADFYRIEDNPLELEEVLESISLSSYSFIEWADKMKGLKENLEKFMVLSFKKNEDDKRLVKITY